MYKTTSSSISIMADWRLALAAVLGVLSPALGQMGKCQQPSSDNTTFYDFKLRNVHKNDTINFSDYRGKVVLLVNVATY